jgi:hypothetical protein
MELIPYLLGGFVLFVLFSSLARARTPPFKVPTFSVFVLGTRGSGKTVFMASMFQRLLAYSEERGYYLRCTDEKLKRRLLETSSKVLAVDQGWPDANMNAIEYPFECAYETKPVGAPDTLCRFTYLDYPGGWLSEADPPKEFSIKKKTQDAHAILVLLDGQKIKDFMDDVNDNVTSDILLLTSVLQQCSPSLKPIYFLITKSDLLDNSQYGFEKTQEALFRIPAFWDFVSTQATKSQLRFRMIFVSAVGPSFCMRDVRTGKMRKLSGGTWSPINIDKSISMTLLDQVRLVADQLDDYVVKKVARGEKTQDYLGRSKRRSLGCPETCRFPRPSITLV